MRTRPGKVSGLWETLTRRAARREAALIAASPMPMWIYDLKTLGFVEVNQSAARQYGYTKEEMLGMTVRDILPPNGTDLIEKNERGELESETTSTHVLKSGTQIEVKLRGHYVRYKGRFCRFVVAEDVTARRHMQAQLFQMAHHDALTGLPNRALLEQRMSQAIAGAKVRGHKAAIICLDLDRFKQVNDWYGHTIGDECLKHIAVVLTRRLRGMDTVARTGGEEFTVVLGEVESVASASMVGRALLQVFVKPIQVEGHEIRLTASMGIAVYPDHGAEMGELWRSADAAMYRAKRAGGNRATLVAPDLTSAAAESIAIEHHMREMLEDGGFLLEYQMQYGMNNQVRGMEGLLRLPHPELGMVSPERFIPLAEANGLIHRLGEWVLREACRHLAVLNGPGEPPIRISVNVSPAQLMRPDFPGEVKRILDETGVNPEWLELEITEQVVLSFEEVSRHMREIAEMGIGFAVDDFGTGYSSLQHLNRLPISTLKIDRSFVQRLGQAGGSYAIIELIIAMGHSMDMQVIAEGVEEELQRTALNQLGCDCVQGFLLAEPLRFEEILLRLGRGSAEAAASLRREPEAGTARPPEPARLGPGSAGLRAELRGGAALGL